MPTGPFIFVIDLHCYNVAIPYFSIYSSTFWIITKSLNSLDTSSNPRQGSKSAPPHPERRYSLALVSTPELPVAQAPVGQIKLPAVQPVIVVQAPPESLNLTFKYWLEADDVPEVNAVVCVVDACTQVSRPQRCPCARWSVCG